MKMQDVKVSLSFDDPNEVLCAMGDDEKIEFLEALSSQDVVIDFVMQQVFEGYTDHNFYRGSESCAWNGNTPLQKFEKKLIEVGADHAIKKRIESLERACDYRDRRIKELEEENYTKEDLLYEHI